MKLRIGGSARVTIIVAVISAIIVAALSPMWALAMIDSLFSFRSPLKDAAPQPGSALGSPATRQVVFVLIDALRLDTSLNPEVMPNLNHLRQRGASAVSHSHPLSYSQPAYSTLLTGAWNEINDGPAANLDYALIPTLTQDNLFNAVHRAGLNTAVSGYYWFEKLIPQASVGSSFYTPGEDQKADRAVVDAALPWLGKDYALVLIHIDQVDYAGHHEGGPISPNWDAAARRADNLLGEILARLDLSKDTIFVTSDHGQIDGGGHGGNEPVELTEPFVLAGAGVKLGAFPDTQMVDIAPTLAALLGANLPASTQGRALVEMLQLPKNTLAALPAAVKAQQSNLVSSYTKAIGQPAPVEAVRSAGEVDSFQKILQNAVAGRQNQERLPRWILLGVVLLLIGLVAWQFSAHTLSWTFGGALAAVLLVHLRIRILDGHAYSLGWVPGQIELILYIAVTTAIGMLVGWLITMFGLNAFRQGRTRAATISLGWMMAIFALLVLPIGFSFALNGSVTTWTLPEMTSYFLGFLSLVQLAISALVGLIFAGIAALIGRTAAMPA